MTKVILLIIFTMCVTGCASMTSEDWSQLLSAIGDAGNNIGNSARNSAQQKYNYTSTTGNNYSDSQNNGIPMYDASQCTGSVINNVCHGTIIPNGYQKKCYGQIISGRCSGAVY